MNMNERIEMTVKFQVKPAQALALQAMFKRWNFFASAGCSRYVAFYVDGDGDFKPKAECTFSAPLPELTPEMIQACDADIKVTPVEKTGDIRDCAFDFDPLYSFLREREGK